MSALALVIPPISICQAHDSAHTIDAKTEELPDGHIQLGVRNTSQIPVTAVLAEGVRQLIGEKHPGRSVRSFDSVLEPFRSQALESGQAYRFIFFGPKPELSRLSERSVAVRAALFADGHTWGEQKWIDTLLSVRKTAYKCESAALQALVDAKAHSTAGEAILQKLQDMEKASKEAAPSVYDRMTAERVFEEVEGNVVMASQVQASLPRSFDPVALTPKSPPLDTAIEAVTSRMRPLEAAAKVVAN
jgi:hypothetical protein